MLALVCCAAACSRACRLTATAERRVARLCCCLQPRMSPEAARKLVEYYRELRQASESDAHTGSYRVTVRQLEALIRLGEARATS